MGAGKSTIGRQLAARTGKQFMDSDKEIEQRTGATIELIFEIEGEQGFRERESRVIEELTENSVRPTIRTARCCKPVINTAA